MKLHLLDATYELFRAYFGAPELLAPDGREVGAVRGLLASVLSLLREDGVTHLAAATDQVIGSFRNDLYPGYKTEAGVPEDLLAQFPLAERGLEAMGVTVWAMRFYEADDALAAAAHRYVDQVSQVIICTPDKDMAQCVVGDRVVLYDRRRQILSDERGVVEKFGIPPESIPDYLALVGDQADGYPGLPGWGQKSAASVLARYWHLEDIPLEPELWEVEVRGSARLADSLRDGLGEALLYRYLATLRREVPLSETIEGLEWQGASRSGFKEFCAELGFEELAERPHRWKE